jgi:hypothetical protein
LKWLLDRFDRFGNGEIDAKDVRVGLEPVKIM